jgi:hypothetical protein
MTVSLEPIGGTPLPYPLQQATPIPVPVSAVKPANVYRFITSDIITGEILADNLPMIGQSATRQINNVGSFQGYLALQTASSQLLELGIDTATIADMTNAWVNACTPWKTLIWILQDGQPIFNGPITAWSPDSIMDGQLPIQAASMEQMFDERVNSDTLTYTDLDIFEIFRQELQYALGKTPNGNIAGTGQYANTSGVVDNVQYSGVLGSITEQAGYQTVYDDFTDLVNAYGLEFAFSAAITDSGSLYTLAQMGLPQMGRLYQNTGLQFVFPGQGMVDYAWQWIPTSPANSVTVTGQGDQSTPVTYTATAQATSELAAGWPLLEAVSSFYGTVTSQAQINGYAEQLLYTTAVNKSLNPIFTVSPQGPVQIKDTQLGDEAYVIATSPLHPAGPNGEPGVAELLRIIGWTLTFPSDGTGESTQFTFGGLQIGPTP